MHQREIEEAILEVCAERFLGKSFIPGQASIAYSLAQREGHIDKLRPLVNSVLQSKASTREEAKTVFNEILDRVFEQQPGLKEQIESNIAKAANYTQRGFTDALLKTSEGKLCLSKITSVIVATVALSAGIGYLWHRHQQKKHQPHHNSQAAWTERIATGMPTDSLSV
jgi:hypothetical protein